MLLTRFVINQIQPFSTVLNYFKFNSTIHYKYSIQPFQLQSIFNKFNHSLCDQITNSRNLLCQSISIDKDKSATHRRLEDEIAEGVVSLLACRWKESTHNYPQHIMGSSPHSLSMLGKQQHEQLVVPGKDAPAAEF